MKMYWTSAVCALWLIAGVGTMRAESKVTLPAGAVLTAPGTYRYTDAGGRKWTYRQTPFGLAKFEEKDGAADESIRKTASNIQATEDGEYVRFERPSPFGTYRWKQKKTELSPLEQAAWDLARQKQKPPSGKE